MAPGVAFNLADRILDVLEGRVVDDELDDDTSEPIATVHVLPAGAEATQ